MDKKLLILLIIIVLMAAVGGFFYLQTLKNDEETARPSPPKLFSKGDYKVEERPDGKYIMVDKVGLTAKVPDGWKVEIKNTSSIESNEYWVDLYSPDKEGESYLKKGCGISINAGYNPESNKDIQETIMQIKNGTKEKETGFFQDYKYEIFKINTKESLKWESPEREKIGKSLGIDMSLKEKMVLGIGIGIADGFSEKCLPIWEIFVKNIVIK